MSTSVGIDHAAPEQLWSAVRAELPGPQGPASFPVVNPATGGAFTDVIDHGVDDVEPALATLRSAGPRMAAMTPQQRADGLLRLAALIEARVDVLAAAITLENGKPLVEARGEVAFSVALLRWAATDAVRLPGDYRLSPDGRTRMLVTRRPVGGCLLVTPWNFPLGMGVRKLASALAAGCAAVLKPAEETPLSALLLAPLVEQAGFPPGALQVVCTAQPGPVVAALMADPAVRKISFTGSTEVGRLLAGQAAAGLLRVSLELGGNAPFVVLADADVAKAVEGAVAAKTRNSGQVCTAANRFVVHRAVAEEFSARLAARLDGMRIGAGWEPDTQLGPLIDDSAVTRVGTIIDAGRHTGAQVLTTREPRPEQAGSFMAPVLLHDVPRDAPLLRQEVFGPVAPVVVVDDDEEAVAVANDTDRGLVSYLYGGDLQRVLRLADRLESGMIALNRPAISEPAAPFGGVKQSGIGREGGYEGIEEYCETVYLAVDA